MDNKFEAVVSITSHDGRYMHVQIRLDADSKQLAQSAIETITNVLTTGRTTLMRVYPESDTYVDYPTREETHRAFARFTFLDEPGQTMDSRYLIERVPSVDHG